jgi:methyl-accepting chemotaxis protein
MPIFGSKKKQVYNELNQKFNKLSEELNLATEFIEKITSGNLDKSLAEMKFTEAQKLSQALQSMQNQLNTFSEAEKQRNWTIEGQAKFGELLRTYNQDIKELSDQLLKFLVNYLQANQGGVFILNDENPNQRFLDLKSCYAYDRKKFTKKQILIEEGYAEGLIGQVFLEGKSTYLNQVPQDYLRITSGLGDASPNYLVIVPLKTNEETLGVLEIASFLPFENYQLDFLEKISESIATSLTVVKTNEITRVLLRESQMQADTLRAQEEELRQNNEELLTTQEEMQRRGNELSSQIESINRSGIILIEFTPQGKIQEANQAFYKLFEYQEQNIINQSHETLKISDDIEKEEYAQFWDNFINGIAQSGEYRFKTQSQERKWLKGGYSPILDADQKTHKIIFIAFDITESKKQMEEINQQATRLQSQEAVLKQNNQKLMQTRDDLQQKIEELNLFKAEEDKRLQERDAKSQIWVSKLKDKFKKQEEDLKEKLKEKEDYIKELENKFVKLN